MQIIINYNAVNSFQFIAILLIAQLAAGARQLRGNRENGRNAKYLENYSFDF